MPRVSIIVAHQQDKRLEDSLLSVLENRPRDSEIIVAHDGSYSDPYQLADEVLFVETNASSSVASKLNEALFAACAPVVHFLGEGVQVTEGWCENASNWITRHGCVAVSPVLEVAGRTHETYAGLDGNRLATRGLQRVKTGSVPERCAGPMLAAGFFSRKWLLALGGLLESVDSQVADVDLALNLIDLDQTCEVDVQSAVCVPGWIVQANHSAGVASDLASIMAAHHQLDSGLVAGIKGAAGRMLASIVNPSRWAPAISWGIGLAGNRLEAEVEDRLAAYRKSQMAQAETIVTRKAA